jgi:hypothetical protein
MPTMKATAMTRTLSNSTVWTKSPSSAPAASAGTTATASMTANRCASRSAGSPRITVAIFVRYSHMMASIDPDWIITVNAGSS